MFIGGKHIGGCDGMFFCFIIINILYHRNLVKVSDIEMIFFRVERLTYVYHPICYTDTVNLNSQGKLVPLLTEAGAITASASS